MAKFTLRFLAVITLMLATNAHAVDMTAQNLLGGGTRPSAQDITITGSFNAPNNSIGTFNNFGNFSSLNLRVTDTLLTRAPRGVFRFGATNADKAKTLNITLAQNYTSNPLFDLRQPGSPLARNGFHITFGNALNIDASAFTGNNLRLFHLSSIQINNGGTSEAGFTIANDAKISGVSGQNYFFQSTFAHYETAYLNHKGGVDFTNAAGNRNFYGEALQMDNTFGHRASQSYTNANNTLANNNFDPFFNSSLNALLQISGDIALNTNDRLYANFTNRVDSGVEKIAHFYGDINVGGGAIFASFIGADFKGNAANQIGNSTGSITGSGIRRLHFVFRNGAGNKAQFDTNVALNADSLVWIDNLPTPVVMDGGWYHADTWANLKAAGLELTGANMDRVKFSRANYEIISGSLRGVSYAVFGNDISGAEVDFWGNNIATTSAYTPSVKTESDAVRTIRKRGSTAPAMVSDGNIGNPNDNKKKEIYFLFKPGTFGDVTDIGDNRGYKQNGGSGYTGIIAGGTADSLYYFRHAGFLEHDQVANALGKVVLDVGTAYRHQLIGLNNSAINVALNLTAQNPLKQQGSIVGSSGTRRVELDFTGMGSATNPHADLKLNIVGNGYNAANAANGYYIYNLKNASTRSANFTDSVAGMLENAGISFSFNAPATLNSQTTYTGSAQNNAPTNAYKITNENTASISPDSKFVLRGSDVVGNLNSADYELDLLFSDTPQGASSFRNAVESATFYGDTIDLRANNRAHKLTFIGDSIKPQTTARAKILLGGAQGVSLSLINAPAIELDASASKDGVYTIQNSEVFNANGAEKIFPLGDARINLINAKVSVSAANPIGVNAEDNALSAQNSQIIATGAASATGILSYNQDLNIHAHITATAPNNAVGIRHNQAFGANTISTAGDISAQVGILANINNGATLTINNYGNIAATKREVEATGRGNLSVGTYVTPLENFGNGARHPIQMSAQNALRFERHIAFNALNNTNPFYLQDMVALDDAGASAAWNPNGDFRAGQVSAGADLIITAPTELFALVLDRNTGLVRFIMEADVAPSTTASKVMFSTMERVSDKVLADAHAASFTIGRNRFMDRGQNLSSQHSFARSERLRAVSEKAHEPSRSGRFYTDGTQMETRTSLNYALYEAWDGAKIYASPYFVKSQLKQNRLYGHMNGVGINGGVTAAIFSGIYLGAHAGAEYSSGKNGASKVEIISKNSTKTLTYGLNARINGMAFNLNKQLYARLAATWQRLESKQESNIMTGEMLDLNAEARFSRFEGLVGVEAGSRWRDKVGAEVGLSQQKAEFLPFSINMNSGSVLKVKPWSFSALYATALARWERQVGVGRLLLVPTIGVGGKFLLSNREVIFPMAFDGVDFGSSANLNRLSAFASFGIDITTAATQFDNFSLGIHYTAQQAQFAKSQMVEGKMTYKF